MNSPGAQRMVGKIALVTGAASSIGRATAHRFAKEGARVALADLDEPEMARIADCRFAEPGEIAAAVIFLAGDEGGHVNGADLPADDGFTIT
jgi:NAD(P)-dependent dehydrogenase (short-subunit alcohol dehydrogenase family)